MRSEEEFEKFISEELKEYACRAEVPARCKAEIDARIIAAESDQKKGGIKQMGNRAVKKRLAAAVICCLLIGTGVFAAGRISTIVSHSSSEPSVTEYEKIKELDPDRPELPEDIREQINIEIKYKGYIERERRQVEAFKKMENKRLPMDIDYEKISGIRIEARQKLNDFKPESVGQASRIQGVSPADISVLLVYLESRR